MLRGLQGIKVKGKKSNFHLGVPFSREFAAGVDDMYDPHIVTFAGCKEIIDVHWILLRVIHRKHSGISKPLTRL